MTQKLSLKGVIKAPLLTQGSKIPLRILSESIVLKSCERSQPCHYSPFSHSESSPIRPLPGFLRTRVVPRADGYSYLLRTILLYFTAKYWTFWEVIGCFLHLPSLLASPICSGSVVNSRAILPHVQSQGLAALLVNFLINHNHSIAPLAGAFLRPTFYPNPTDATICLTLSKCINASYRKRFIHQ